MTDTMFPRFPIFLRTTRTDTTIIVCFSTVYCFIKKDDIFLSRLRAHSWLSLHKTRCTCWSVNIAQCFVQETPWCMTLLGFTCSVCNFYRINCSFAFSVCATELQNNTTLQFVRRMTVNTFSIVISEQR